MDILSPDNWSGSHSDKDKRMMLVGQMPSKGEEAAVNTKEDSLKKEIEEIVKTADHTQIMAKLPTGTSIEFGGSVAFDATKVLRMVDSELVVEEVATPSHNEYIVEQKGAGTFRVYGYSPQHQGYGSWKEGDSTSIVTDVGKKVSTLLSVAEAYKPDMQGSQYTDYRYVSIVPMEGDNGNSVVSVYYFQEGNDITARLGLSMIRVSAELPTVKADELKVLCESDPVNINEFLEGLLPEVKIGDKDVINMKPAKGAYIFDQDNIGSIAKLDGNSSNGGDVTEALKRARLVMYRQ